MDQLTLVDRAIALANRAHRSQRYAGKPYIAHLVDVVNTLYRSGFESDVMIAAAWLHDSIEDTPVTVADVAAECGDEVAELVFAVTNEEGKNRRERNARTYPKIQAVPGAVTLKLADRISNVESCWATRNSKLFMYQREYKGFRKALRKDPEPDAGVVLLWDRLDSLLGWWEPS